MPPRRCYLHKGHDGPHTLMRPSRLPPEPCLARAPKGVGVVPKRKKSGRGGSGPK